ncbi:MAG: Trigger factor [Candidatus Curtissbacteria bacterium GW2011_GWA1_40_16]|uniref:Trigger factor n=1 Tax=Candidatus Curtissbacteria bacterium GW2011_GWA1_40_16 TaxID=1618405 RepID=A0A0G0RMU1_9BACT|nr:MAG: Trigger factor [Candidatus Curtissbacteria bacterium GW2011_GWA1_40_16]
MQYTVTRGDKGKVDVKVDVPKLAFSEAYDKAVETLSKDVKVSGFRPGHVPRDVVEGQIGTGRILNEAANSLVSKHLGEIFEKENIVPITSPKIAVETLSLDSPFSFTATLVQRPKVKLGDWKKISIKKVAVKPVGDADVEQSIKNIYEAWQKSSSAKATEGQGKKEEDDQASSGKFIYDAHGNKIPIKQDKKNEDESDESKIDDEFAKAVGANDLAHLKDLVRRDLENLVIDQAENKLEEELFDKMLEMGEIDVPDILVDDELNRIMMRLNQELERQGKKTEDFLREENTTMDALRAKWRPQAEKNVKTTLIMDEIGKQEKVQISKEELENAFKGVDESKLSEQQKVDLQQYIAVSLFQAKTLALVKKTVAAA